MHQNNGLFVAGSWLHADQDPWGLLLLCFGTSCVPPPARQELCCHGAGDDRGYQVGLDIMED